MSRVISIITLVFLLIGYAQAQKGEIYLPRDKGLTIRNEVAACVKELDGDMQDMLDQIYAWEIKNEDKMKRLFLCFFQKENDTAFKFVPGNVLKMLDDFDKKDEVAKVLQDCETQSTGSNRVDRIFSFIRCYITNTPVIIKV